MKIKNIAICGFSGAGKSYWLEQLQSSKKISNKWRFFDLDQEIAKNLGVKPSELGEWIDINGWESFRLIESTTLEEILSWTHIIIALGGGTITQDNLFKFETDELETLWLDESFTRCWERISTDSNRPMVKQGKKSLELLFQQRRQCYEHFPQFTTGEELTCEIIKLTSKAEQKTQD